MKPISISLAPNNEKDDIQLATRIIFGCLPWKKGPQIRLFEKRFSNYLGVSGGVSFNSGRSSYIAILKALDLGKKNQVLLQAFTCNAAVNPVLKLGLEPVFVDCDETFNLDPEDLKEKITSKSRVVVVQHTFGQPAKLDKILKICKDHDLILIEDCAHSLGAEYGGKKVGTLGTAAFFSFSRDKIISSIYGGIAVSSRESVLEKIKNIQKDWDFPSRIWIFQQLLYPGLMEYVVLPAYRLPSIGKLILNSFQISKILSKSVHPKEKKGGLPSYFPKKFPNALAALALNQFKKLERFRKHREKIASFYQTKLKDKDVTFQKGLNQAHRTYMRFPILLPSGLDSDEVLKRAREEGILLDDGWRKTPIVPLDTSQEKMHYRWGSCPRAEEIAQRILNLPTHINISQNKAQKIVSFLELILS